MRKGTEGCAYSDIISIYIELFSKFADDKMMPQAVTVHDKFIIILLQYIIFLFWTLYLPNKQ